MIKINSKLMALAAAAPVPDCRRLLEARRHLDVDGHLDRYDDVARRDGQHDVRRRHVGLHVGNHHHHDDHHVAVIDRF